MVARGTQPTNGIGTERLPLRLDGSEVSMRHLSWLFVGSLLVCVFASGTARAEWVEQFTLQGDGNSALGVAAADDLRAVAGGKSNQGQGDSPSVWFTANGNSWAAGTLGGQFSFILRLSFADASTVYGAGLGLHKSKDGGSSFAAVSVSGVSGFDMVSDVFAVNTNYVYAVTGNKVIYTGNGGLNWATTNTGVGQTFEAVYFLDNLRGWVVGGRQEEITETDPYSGEEVTTGYDVKEEGLVMYTEDGARNWAPLLIGSPDIFHSIFMLDQNIGLATASSNANPYFIKRTVDGGKTWQDINLPTPLGAGAKWVYLTRVLMLSPLHAIAAGSVGVDGGGFGNKAVVIESFDGGITWAYTPEAQGNGAYYDIAFPCENAGWAVGDWARIVKYTNGGGCAGITNPDGDNPEAGDDVTEADVWTWGHMFGTFGDDKLVSENSAPGDTDAWGGVIPGDDDLGAGCKETTKSSGCSASETAHPAALILFALSLALLVLARRFRRAPVALMLVALPLALASCGSEDTVVVCEDVQSTTPPADVTSDDAADTTVQPEAFSCQLQPGITAASFTGSTQRKANVRDRIVFVRETEEGGSDLWVMAPDGSSQKALTRFEDPAVQVFYPTWSPNRDFVAFLSNYRYSYNEYRYNVFVIAADGSICYQVSPGVEKVRAKAAGDTVTIQGSFRFGQGAIAAPVAAASVAVEGGSNVVTTGQGGEFQITAPAGSGRLILRGSVNGMSIIGTADYEGSAGDTVTLTGIVGKSEGTQEVGPIHWAPTGTTAFYFMKDTLVHTSSVQMNTGEVTNVFEQDEDAVSALGLMPAGGQAVVAFRSKPTHVGVYDLTDLEETVMEFDWEGQTEDSRIAISPLYFLASLQGDTVQLLGADEAGELATHDVTPANLSGLVPEQFDWSLDATHLVLTIQGASGTNLASLDVNEKKLKVLTTDGKSSMPAWFGR